MNTKPKIVIVGGGYAGLTAALRLAGKAAKHAGITLINARKGFGHRIRNHQLAAQRQIRHDSIPDLLGRRPVRFVQGYVTAMDLDRHTVTLDSGETIAYDKLVYALGSMATKSDIPGVSEHAYNVGSIAGAEALAARLASLPAAAQIVVVGGGLTGIETATELADSRPDLRVKLVTQGTIGEFLSERGRAYIRQTFASLRLDLQEHTRVQRIEAGQLITEQGHAIPFDVAIWAGAFAVPSLAQEAGLAVDAAGRVQVDSWLRSISHPDVYAVGDSSVLIDRSPLRMACATAFSTGAHAADNLAAWAAGKPQQPFRFHYSGVCISLGRKHALLQFVDKDDRAQDRIITGFAAKLIKESVYHGMIWGLKLERVLPGAIRWPGQNSRPPKPDTQQAKLAVSPQEI